MHDTTRTIFSARRLSAITAFLGCVLGVGEADAERFEVAMGRSDQYMQSQSMEAISAERGVGSFSLVAGVALPELSLVPGFHSEVALNWEHGSMQGTTFNRIRSDLNLDTLVASGRLRRPILFPGLSTYGRLGLGAQWADLSLEDADAEASRPLHGDGRAMVTEVAAGLDYTIDFGEKNVFHLGIRLEAGYRVASSLDFRAQPRDESEDSLSLDTMASSLGSLNTSGPMLGVSAYARY